MDVDVVDLMNTSFRKALSLEDRGDGRLTIHQVRSRTFVNQIAAYFAARCLPNQRVLTRGSPEHRDDFGVNELLFDVLVCECATTRAAVAEMLLPFVSKGLWAVESEFARDSRHALRDFQKLVLADCESKLFIGPEVSDPPAFLRPLGEVAACCRGTVYTAFVPHPDTWGEIRNSSGASAVVVHSWVNGAWQPVPPQA